MMRDVIQEDPTKSEAAFYLGFLHEHGLGVSQDSLTALKYYLQSAHNDHAQACNKVGDFYYSGIAIERPNVQEALQWYERASALGNIEALLNLGTIYEEGNKLGVKQNMPYAINCFRTASNLGDSRGYLNLAYIYEIV
jgi:TPR repeat protein